MDFPILLQNSRHPAKLASQHNTEALRNQFFFALLSMFFSTIFKTFCQFAGGVHAMITQEFLILI